MTRLPLIRKARDEKADWRDVPLIPAQFVREAVAAAQQEGVDWKSLLASLELSPKLNQPVHIKQFARLWKGISEAIGDDFLSLGERPLPPGALDFLAHAVVHSTNFRETMGRCLDYLAILIRRPRGRLEIRDGLAELVFDSDDVLRTPFSYHLVWIIVGGLTGWLVGRRVALRQVDFTCAKPDDGADFREMLRATIRFSQPRTRFVFDAEYLDLPVVRQRYSLETFLTQMPGVLLLRYWDERTLSSTIRKMLGITPPADWPTLNYLAREMDIPSSTLRRRLRVEGHSYNAIKDDIRRMRAVQALLHSTLSVEQIAELLGFAEPSAFHRAFRKWVSCSPGAFRRNNNAGR